MIEQGSGEARIRSDEADVCPYGLCISCACKNVGDLINNMSPVDILGSDASKEEKYAIKKANEHILIWHNPKSRCKYAEKFFEENDKVVLCNFDAERMGMPENAALVGSPYYYKHFSGVGTDGLYSYPLGYFADNSIDRGLYYGMYSIEGIATNLNKEDMTKQGNDSGWTKYVSSNNHGIYIKSKLKEIYYGPFKTYGHAEFFNYLAFVSPTSTDASVECKAGIVEIKQEDFTKLGMKTPQFLHPSNICFESSSAGYWWENMYGNRLTEKMVLALAQECGANGYDSFKKWLINGSKIKGKSAHHICQ